MIDVVGLEQSAREQTGLSDFGGDSYCEPLGVLVDALNGEARLSEFGIFAVKAMLSRRLAARLQITDYLAQNPEVANEPVSAPITVMGHGRSGTTYLHNLLHQDPALRALTVWEADAPVPPPTPDTYADDPRIEQTTMNLQAMYKMAPNLAAVSHHEATGATECLQLLELDFRSMGYVVMFSVPSYTRWLEGADVTPAYAWHRRALQVLQSLMPESRWALKSPAHLSGLDGLVRTYPDALLVATHRDPVKMVASMASLFVHLRAVRSDRVDLNECGRHAFHSTLDMQNRFDAFLDAKGEDSVVHIPYQQLIDEPIRAIEHIYSSARLEFSNEARSRMNGFTREQPQGKHGAHSYGLLEFGLDAEEIRGSFKSYIDRFDIQTDNRK